MARIRSISLAAAAFLLVGCSISGPASLAAGRSAYNRIINKTEDEQFLSMIVRQRYDETFGMLTVASVTSSISTVAKLGSEIGIGPEYLYERNIVPLALGFAYEERPTISYVPVAGEVYLQRALEPISLRDLYLLGRASHRSSSMLAFMIHRVNGIANAVPGHKGAAPAFLRVAEAYEQLHRMGSAELVRTEAEGEYAMAIMDYEGREPMVRTLLDALGLGEHEVDGELILLPIQTGIGRVPGRVTLETRSVLDMIRSIGESIDIPQEHLDSGVAGARPSDVGLGGGFLRIRSSANFPSNASVATSHRDHWFYIDASDTLSKRSFVLMRTLVGIRLSNPGAIKKAPALTIPVN